MAMDLFGGLAFAVRRLGRCAVATVGLATMTPAAAADIVASDAWVFASVNAMRTTTAFATLSAPQGATLVAVRTPAARKVNILETRTVSGLEVGWPLGRIQIPAGTPVRLRPGGLHLELLDTETLLEQGDQVSLTLAFDTADGRVEITVKASVRGR